MATNTAATITTTILLLAVLAIDGSYGDVESDRKECGDALMALATCLTYVGGSSKSPTPDCCAGLRRMLSSSPKCLCLLIKDHDNPAVDLKMDPARAMSLPSDCGAPANISYCPKLLHLQPGSPDAKIFEDFKNKSHDSENGIASDTNAVGVSSNSSSYAGRSSFHGIGENLGFLWMRMEVICCFFTYLLMLILTN